MLLSSLNAEQHSLFFTKMRQFYADNCDKKCQTGCLKCEEIFIDDIAMAYYQDGDQISLFEYEEQLGNELLATILLKGDGLNVL